VTEPVHPTLEELAELHEGVLDAERSPGVAAHLASCAECTRAAAALSEVGTVLIAAGSASTPMPADRAASLHDALGRASAERAADVASLAERRERPQPRRHARSGTVRGWASAAAAAAAVVLVGYGGVSLLNSGGANSASSSDSAGMQGGAAARKPNQSLAQPSTTPRPFGAQRPGKAAAGMQKVTPQNLARYAAALGANPEYVPVKPACGATVIDVPSRSRAATIRWKGVRALVVVDPSHQRAKVYSCRDAAVLFSTRY
jgi:hypothetical protein